MWEIGNKLSSAKTCHLATHGDTIFYSKWNILTTELLALLMPSLSFCFQGDFNIATYYNCTEDGSRMSSKVFKF